MKARDIPNLICVVRILLVIPIVVLLLQEAYATVLLLFAIAGASDGLDGFLARRFNWQSRLGSILDPLADKLLMVCVYATLGWMTLLPPWVVLIVLARDVVIVTGAFAYDRLVAGVEVEPSRISKANTFFQIVLVLLVMTIPLGLPLGSWLVDSMIWVVVFTTFYSGGNYIWVWSMRAHEKRLEGEGKE